MNTPNDFMIEMGRLFGTGRGGQMNDLEAMQLEAQKNQLMEERARQEAVQRYVMGDENRLPGVQESQVGQNTARAGQMANDQNARMNPIAVKQARANLTGSDINNQVAAHLRDYRIAGDTVDGDPVGMAGVFSGEQRQKINRDTKAYNDNETASAAGAALLGSPTGLASLFKTPGQNGANVAKADSEQSTEATQMPGLENPGVPVQGIAPFTNGPGFNVLQQVAAYHQNATGAQQAAEANSTRNKIQALEAAATYGAFGSAGQQASVDALGALGGVPQRPATPAPNPLGDAARRVDASRRGVQGGGGGGVTEQNNPVYGPPEAAPLSKFLSSFITDNNFQGSMGTAAPQAADQLQKAFQYDGSLGGASPMNRQAQPSAPAPAPMLPPAEFDRFPGVSSEAMQPSDGARPAYMQSRNPSSEAAQGPLSAYQSFIQGLKENAYSREPVQPAPAPERYSGAGPFLSSYVGPAQVPQPPANFQRQGPLHPSLQPEPQTQPTFTRQGPISQAARNPATNRPASPYGPMGDQMQANDDLLTQLMQFLSIK